MVGGELHYVRGFRHEPGYYGWVGVMSSLYLSLTGGGMFSAYHRKLTNGRVLTQGVKVLSYKYIDVNKQCTPATNAIMVELHPPAISIHKGVEVHACVEGEFKPIGTIH